jgi:hypothetical protein
MYIYTAVRENRLAEYGTHCREAVVIDNGNGQASSSSYVAEDMRLACTTYMYS